MLITIILFFMFAVNHLPYCLFVWWISRNIFLAPISYIYFLFLYFYFIYYFISFVLAKWLHVCWPVLSPFLGSPFLHEFHHCPSSLLHPHPLCKCNAKKFIHKNSSLNISTSLIWKISKWCNSRQLSLSGRELFHGKYWVECLLWGSFV